MIIRLRMETGTVSKSQQHEQKAENNPKAINSFYNTAKICHTRRHALACPLTKNDLVK